MTNMDLISQDAEAQRVEIQALFLAHMDVVRSSILALCPGFDMAEDILQETFLTVTRKAAEFRPGTNFTAWACTIARLKVLETRYQKRRNGPVFSPELIAALCATHTDELEDAGEHKFNALSECLNKLTPKARHIVNLRYQKSHTLPGISETIGWTTEAVQVALSRARTALRKCIEQRLVTPNE